LRQAGERQKMADSNTTNMVSRTISSDRETRFPDSSSGVTPAGVERLLSSRAHVELRQAIKDATSFRAFTTLGEIDVSPELAARLLATAKGPLAAQALVKSRLQAFVPMYDNRDDIEFFMLDGHPACIMDGGMNLFIASHSPAVSYERWACAACGLLTDGRLKCGACRNVVYCSRVCQSLHWSAANGHRASCGAVP